MSVALAVTWLAGVLALGAGVMAVAALRARSLFVTAACVAGVVALAAAAALLLGGGDGAVAMAAFGVAFAPLVIMAGVLLTARTARTTRGGLWVSVVAVVAGLAAAAVIAPELGGAPAALLSHAPISLWLGALVFVAAAGCVAVLGYGERGVLQRPEPEPDA